MPKPPMSDAELRRRRKVQGQIGRTTSTLGLTGVGLAAGGAALARKPGALKAIPKVGSKVSPQKLKDAAFYTGIASGGIGGVGGFNAASIYSDEARRKKQTELKKELGMDMGFYGEEGRPVKLEEIKVPIEKAWTPVASNYDPEAKRHKRNQTTQAALSVGGGTAVGAGVGMGAHARSQFRAAKKIKNAPVASHPPKFVPGAPSRPRKISGVEGAQGPMTRGQANWVKSHATKVANKQEAAWSEARASAQKARAGNKLKAVRLQAKGVKNLKRGGAVALGGAAALGGAELIRHRRKSGSWDSYSKRDVSAFGVAYLNPTGRPHETESRGR